MDSRKTWRHWRIEIAILLTMAFWLSGFKDDDIIDDGVDVPMCNSISGDLVVHVQYH